MSLKTDKIFGSFFLLSFVVCQERDSLFGVIFELISLLLCILTHPFKLGDIIGWRF